MDQAEVAWLNNEQFVVVWDKYNGSGSDYYEIRARIFDDNSNFPTPLTGEIAVNSTSAGDQENPTLTVLPDGGFVVAWEDASGVGVDNDLAIRLQAFDAAGDKIGGEFVVNTTTTGNQSAPSVSALPDGRVVVTWTDASQSGGDTSGSAIRMQIIDPRDGIVTGTPGNDTRYGNDQVNDEISGGAGDDTLYGMRGDDALYGGQGNDTLNGGPGADIMVGGTGNDTYYVDNADDQVTELLGKGSDTIYASVSYALPAGQAIEFLRANAGATGLILTGNELNNTTVGGAGNDTLEGGAGSDTLIGGRGADVLTGGTGADVFRFKAPSDSTVAVAGREHDHRFHSWG